MPEFFTDITSEAMRIFREDLGLSPTDYDVVLNLPHPFMFFMVTDRGILLIPVVTGSCSSLSH